MSDPVAALADILAEGWLVGGAVRDDLLGRPTADFDVVLAGDPEPVARALARAARGHPFVLSEGFGGWRVVARDHRWQLDLFALGGTTIQEDLRRRDFTINAMARPLGSAELIDPLGGLADARAGVLRAASPEAFTADPLRVLRLARFVSQLGFAPDAPTAELAAASAPALAGVAAERLFMELRATIAGPGALDGLALLESLGMARAFLPELSDLRGVAQSRFHHLDVYEHTRAVLAALIELEHDPAAVFGAQAPAILEVLSEPLADELTRAQALRLGALFHDIAKPQTRAVSGEGRVTFLGHDAEGAEMAARALGRLRASERLAGYVAAVTRHHLRLGFLVHEMPLSRRTVYRYLKACEPVAVDVTVLSVADRLATRGHGSEAAIARHLELAAQMMHEALAWRRRPPRPPVRGDELAAAARVEPGPKLGAVLAELEEAAFAGEIAGREQALDRGLALLRDGTASASSG